MAISRYAWVTYANNPTHIETALSLFKSLQLTNTKYDCILMTPYEHIPQALYVNANIQNLKVKQVIALDKTLSNHASVRFSACLNKVYVWGLTEYEKVCWLDGDMIVMKNIDHLFDINFDQSTQMLGASGCSCNHFKNPRLPTLPHNCPFVNQSNTYINAGLMLIKPNQQTMHTLLQEDFDQPLADQDVVNKVFKGSINTLPSTYNYMSHLDLVHPIVDGSDVHIFHFTYDKPWDTKGRNTHKRYYDHWRLCHRLIKL
jgi:alpha-N-acetylglucosamine transferase